jgi:uncharacterized membrane protein
MKQSTNVEKLILTGLMTALVTVTTIVIPIPVPFTNGYVHPGDGMIFMSVLLLGRRRAAFAAGVGSALADVILGYLIWAPFTLVIKSIMAFVAGLIIEKCAERPRNLVISCVSVPVLWALFYVALLGFARYLVNLTYNAGTELLATEGAGGAAGAVSMTEMLGPTMQYNAHMWSVPMLASALLPVLLILIAAVLRRKEHISVPPGHIVGMTGGGIFMVFGYYIADGLITGNFMTAAFGIPANIAQFAVGFIIASLLSAALQNTSAKRYFTYGAKKAEPDKAL